MHCPHKHTFMAFVPAQALLDLRVFVGLTCSHCESRREGMKEARSVDGWTQNCMVMFPFHSVSQNQLTD